jgi:hypothetical protein
MFKKLVPPFTFLVLVCSTTFVAHAGETGGAGSGGGMASNAQHCITEAVEQKSKSINFNSLPDSYNTMIGCGGTTSQVLCILNATAKIKTGENTAILMKEKIDDCFKRNP